MQKYENKHHHKNILTKWKSKYEILFVKYHPTQPKLKIVPCSVLSTYNIDDFFLIEIDIRFDYNLKKFFFFYNPNIPFNIGKPRAPNPAATKGAIPPF